MKMPLASMKSLNARKTNHNITYHVINKNKTGGDELPGVRRLGCLSHLYGQLSRKSRDGWRNRMVLCHPGHRVHLHADNYGHYRRQVHSAAAHAWNLPFLCRRGNDSPLRSRPAGSRTQQDTVYQHLHIQRSVLYAYTRLVEHHRVHNPSQQPLRHRERFPADPCARHCRIHRNDVAHGRTAISDSRSARTITSSSTPACSSSCRAS